MNVDHLKQKVVIIGATSAIAEHCARLWAADGPKHFLLVGRDSSRLESVSGDLLVRSPTSRIECLTTSFTDPSAIAQLAEEACMGQPVDTVLIAHGSLPSQAACQTDLSQARDAIEINALSPVLFAEAFVGHMEKANRGCIGIIGSVAGDRGRKSNYAYGAAKGLVDRYAQGLQHRLARTSVRVVLIKPGPTDTPMTSHLKATGARLASVESVANDIVKGMASARPTVYAPSKWAVIMFVIRHLPRRVFNRLDI